MSEQQKYICVLWPKVKGLLENQQSLRPPTIAAHEVNSKIRTNVNLNNNQSVKQWAWNDKKLYILFETFPWKSGYFCRIVEHDGHHRRIIVPKDFKTHLLQFWSEKIAIFTNACQFLSPYNNKVALKISTQFLLPRYSDAIRMITKCKIGVNFDSQSFWPLLEPSSPSITLIAEMICWAAGGDIDVAYRWAGQVYFKNSISSWNWW